MNEKNNFMKSKRFNLLMISSLTLLLILTAFFNFVIDPFYIFKTPLLNGINSEKPELKRQERVTKIIELKLMPKNIDTVILGASTVDMGIDANYYTSKTSKKAKNIAFVGPDIIELIDYFKIVHNIHPEIKTLILGLDFFSFKATNTDEYKFNKNKFLTPQEICQVLISFDALNSSFETLKYNIYNPNKPVYNLNGSKINMKDDKINDKFELILNAYINGNGYYKNYVISRQKLQEFDKFTDYCKKNHIKLILFVNPIHFSQFQAIKTASAWNQFKQWKKDISLIYPYYDFSNLNNSSNEEIKPDMKFYFDPIHYSTFIGDRIVDEILGDKASFSSFVNINDVNTENNKLDRNYEYYSKKNIKLINWVNSLKK